MDRLAHDERFSLTLSWYAVGAEMEPNMDSRLDAYIPQRSSELHSFATDGSKIRTRQNAHP